MTSVFLLALIFVPMLLEARLAHRNERTLIAQGALEPDDDVFPVMRVVYPLCFLAMVAEGWSRTSTTAGVFVMGASIFLTAKLLKYWAVRSLGSRWSFRVLVPPNSPLVTSGPYRYLHHPNYVGVVGELLGVALMAYAPVTGCLSLVVFGVVLIARVRTENRALGIGERAQSSKTRVL
jgi:methyltransferase